MDDRDDIDEFFKRFFSSFGRIGANVWPPLHENSPKTKQNTDDTIDPVFAEHIRNFNKVFDETNQMMRSFSFAGGFNFGNKKDQSFSGMIGFDEKKTDTNNANLRDSFLKNDSNESKQLQQKEPTSFVSEICKFSNF